MGSVELCSSHNYSVQSEHHQLEKRIYYPLEHTCDVLCQLFLDSLSYCQEIQRLPFNIIIPPSYHNRYILMIGAEEVMGLSIRVEDERLPN